MRSARGLLRRDASALLRYGMICCVLRKELLPFGGSFCLPVYSPVGWKPHQRGKCLGCNPQVSAGKDA